MSYFGWDYGRFVFHNDSTQSIGLQVNGWNAENGLLVYQDKVAFINNVEVSGSITLPYGATISENVDNALAFGLGAGVFQQNDAIAIGNNAGVTQNYDAIAIGAYAGGQSGSQGQEAIAIGLAAGGENQGYGAVAIGTGAG
jgi:hypothetical protein